MTEPYPLDGSYISEKLGIHIKTRREADTIRLLHLAVNDGCFTWDGEFGDIFRVYESNGIWICQTAKYPRVVVNKYIAERWCNYHGFDFEEF